MKLWRERGSFPLFANYFFQLSMVSLTVIKYDIILHFLRIASEALFYLFIILRIQLDWKTIYLILQIAALAASR